MEILHYKERHESKCNGLSNKYEFLYN